MPLRAREHVLGAITLVRTGGRPGYGEDDVAFVGEVAARAALAVDNARLYGEARAQERASGEAQALLDALVDGGADRPGLPRHRLPLRARQRRAGRDQRRAGDRPSRPHRARGAARAWPTDIEAALEEVLATGEAIVDLQIVGETPREPGRDRHYVASYYPVALARGESLGIGITVADVTDRAEAAQALREQRDLYEALMRAQSELGLAFVLLDGDRIVYANAATEALTGRSARRALRAALDPRRRCRSTSIARWPGAWPACARGASRPSRSAPRSSAPTARACRSRRRAGGWAARWTRAWRSSRATSPIAWRRSASCSGCSRSSRLRAAPARPRTPACGCWPTPARCSSAR